MNKTPANKRHGSKTKRAISVILAFTVILLCQLAFTNVYATDLSANDAFAFDDFSSDALMTGVTTQWNTHAYGAADTAVVSDGKLTLTAGSGVNSEVNAAGVYLSQSNGVTDYAQQWTDYSVEMKVSISSSSTGTGQDKVGLIGRMTESDGVKSFYYAYIRKDQSRVFLYHPTISANNRMSLGSVIVYPTIPQTVTDTEYTLKMTFEGDNIKVFVNDVEYINITDTTNSCGTAGILGTRGVVAEVDDFKITMPKPSKSFQDTFDDARYMTGVTAKWNTHAFGALDTAVIASDKLTVTAGSGTNAEKNNCGVFLSQSDGTTDYAQQWTNYSVEATAKILSSSTGTGHDKIGLVGRMTETDGVKSFYYTYIRKDMTYVWLYKGTIAANGNTTLNLITYPRIPKTFTDTDYTLKMTFEGDNIKVFVDGVEYINITDTTNSCGTAGVLGTRGVIAEVDDFKVFPVGADDGACFKKYTFDEASDVRALSGIWNLTPAATGTFSIENDQLAYADAGSGVGFAGLKEKQMYAFADAQVIAEGTASAGSGFAVYGRYNSAASSYYKLALDLDDGLVLSEANAGVDSELFTISREVLWENYGLMLNADAVQQLKLQLVGSRVEAFLNDACVYYFDDPDWVDGDTLSSGVGAVEFQNGAKISSMEIKEAQVITNLAIMQDTNCNGKDAGLKNYLVPFTATVQVPVGKTPDLKHLYLLATWSDGTETVVPVDALQVGEFHVDAPSDVQTATITYERQTVQLQYKVIDRTADIVQLDTELAALQPGSLTLDDKSAVYALADRYNDLSAAEKAGILAENLQNLKDAKETIELLLYPALVGTEIVFEDNFDTAASEAFYTSDRMATRTKFMGNWFVENGAYYQYFVDDTDRTSSFQCANVVKDGNWEIKSVSADVEIVDRNVWVGLDIPFGENSMYWFMISDKKSAGYESRIYLYKDKTVLAKKIVTDPSEAFNVGEVYNLRLIFDAGTICCYINDELVLEAEDTVDSVLDAVYTSGSAGFLNCEGFGKFDNFVIRGVEVTPEITTDPVLTPGSYSDDFNDEAVGTDPSHWIEEEEHNDWTVTADGAYGSTGCIGTETETWLHVFETDVDYTANLKITDSGLYPAVGLMARVNYADSYVKAGYDFVLQKWFIKVRFGTDFEEVAVYSDTDTSVGFTDWTQLRLLAEGSELSLFVDGGAEPVLTADALQKVMPGRVGVFAERCDVCIDDVVLQLLSGQGRVNEGVQEFYTEQQYCSILPLSTYDGDGPNDDLLMFSYGSREVSSDGGKTFRITTAYGSQSLGTATQLHDGSYIAVTNGEVFFSIDVINWVKVGELPVEYTDGSTTVYTQTGDRVTEIEISDGVYRIFFTTDKHINAVVDGANRNTVSDTFYSDDAGVTWTMSMNSAANVTNMNSFAETNIIRATDGRLLQYCSYNNSQQMRYMVSNDNGVTWEGDYAIPYIVDGGVVSFCVKEDPYAPGTYYMTTVFNRTQHDQDGMPRLRVVLLRSYDGYEWEFLGDVDRWGDHSEGSKADMMQNINMYLTITPDAVFPMFCRAEQWKPGEAHNIRFGRAYRFEKATLSAYSEWPAEVVWQDNTITHIEGKTTEIAQNSDPREVEFTVYYYGGTSEDLTAEDAFISGLDTTTLGEQTVTIDYRRFRTIFQVNVVLAE